MKKNVIIGIFNIDVYFLDSATEPPTPDEPYIRGEKSTFVVFEGSIGEHKLIYSSKLKALDNPDDMMNLESATFTDLRTNMGRAITAIKW